jgi:DNA-binding HxlR family transcriptional regulator
VSRRTYGQYCGFARALEIVGERWALLIVRDLLIGPKRFGEIERGLPGIPTNILSARLGELEQAGIVERRPLTRPARGVAYALTQAGLELEDAVIAIGRWGAKRLGEPRPGEVVTEDSIASALLTTFRPESARGADVTYLLRLGAIEVIARVHRGALTVERGAQSDADLVIETDPVMRQLMAREISPREAIERKLVHVTGDPALLDRFVSMFAI